MKTAIVTGVSGQDGSYMAELLQQKGYRVIGLVRNTETAEQKLNDFSVKVAELIAWDMLHQEALETLLAEYKPDEVYNFAAYSSGSGMYDEPVNMGEINGLAVTRILEAIRKVNTKIKFCQASSSELFGEAEESPQSETTRFNPRSPYGAAKLYAHSMINIYRKKHGLFASSAILFNHESPRRGMGFVTRKITHEAAKIKLGLATELLLGNLDARRDWGFAGDYVFAMWKMLQHNRADDYVISSGQTHSVRELCETAFSHLGLDYRDYVRESRDAFRQAEKVELVGNSSRARNELGWQPEVDFTTLITMMVDADLKQLRNNI